MANAQQKIMSARTSLVLDQCFFGTLVLSLKMREDPTCETAWVNGRDLGYNPTWIESLTHSQVEAVLCHEVMHCAEGHPWRRDGRDVGLWNVACDKPINQVLSESNFTLPKDCLMPVGDEKDKSAEWIYARMPKSDQGGNGQDQGQGRSQGTQQGQGQGQGKGKQQGKGEGQGSSLGEVRDAPTGADEEGQEAPTEGDWQQQVQQAAQLAKGRGKLPGGLARFAAEAVAPRVDWKSALRRFVQEHCKSDYSWSKPNRRYISCGMYLPSLESIEMGEMVIGVDTSGSIDETTLAQFSSEIDSICNEVKPSRVHVMYCDSRVHKVETFEKDEAVVLKACGGGGTSFGPVFKKVDEEAITPTCLVYLTDLDGYCDQQAPQYPVLWASTQDRTAPFGEVVRIDV